MSVSDSLWVTTIINSGRGLVSNPAVASFLTLGWIPLFISLVVLSAGSPNQGFAVSQLLTASIVVLGPYQAYKYDTEVLPGFFNKISAIVVEEDQDQVEEIRTQALQLFRNKHAPFVLVWTVMVVSVLPLNSEYFATQGIVPTDLLYWVYLCFLIDFGLLSGLGLFSVIITTYSIRSIADLQLQIEPLHPDGLGGLSTIGEFAIWTTLLISNGALAIPLSLNMVTSFTGAVVVYSGIGLYVLLILMSFVYPTAKVNRQAQKLREEHLERYRSKIRSLEQNISQPAAGETTNRELALQLEIDRVRKEFRDYQNVRLYPLSIGILIRLTSSVALPIVFILIDHYISRIL
jgi:hypothetical protein